MEGQDVSTTAPKPKAGAKTTPPKGRPTRSIHDPQPRRTFGSTAQWLAVFAAIGLAILILWITLDDNAKMLNGAPSAPAQPATVVLGVA